MSRNGKTLSVVAIKITLSIIAFYVISKRITINPLHYLNKNTVYYFILALTCSLGLIFLQASRWKSIVKVFAINLSYKKCLISVWAGHLINNILPAALAGDLMRSYTLRYADGQNKKLKWLGAFFSEKYCAATSALLLACISLISSVATELPLLLTLFIVTLFLMLIITPVIIIKTFPKFNFSTIKLVNYIHKMNQQLANSFLDRNGRHAFISSTVINLGMCIVFYIIAAGLGAQIKFTECLFVVPVFTLLASLPISYAGWGVRELSCVALLQFFGVPAETAVIVSIMYGFIFLLSSVPGVLVAYSFITSRHDFIA